MNMDADGQTTTISQLSIDCNYEFTVQKALVMDSSVETVSVLFALLVFI